MSVISLLLWSTTPLLGLAVLLGMSRFERYLLEDRDDARAGEDPWAANEARREAAEIAGLVGNARNTPIRRSGQTAA